MKLRLRRPLAMLLTVVMLLGLLPTAAFAAEPRSSAELTTLTLTPASGESIDLMTNDAQIQWSILETWTLDLNADLVTGQESTLTVTLAPGMQFVNLDVEALKDRLGVRDAVWTPGTPDWAENYENYEVKSGTLTVTFASGASSLENFQFSLKPDTDLFPPELSGEGKGLAIKDAISVKLDGSNTYSADVTATHNIGGNPFFGDVSQSVFNIPSGAESQIEITGYLYAGWPQNNGVLTKRLLRELSAKIAVPEGLTITPANALTVEKTEETDEDGNIIWTVTANNIFGISTYVKLDCTIPQEKAIANEEYVITIKHITAATEGQQTALETNHNTTAWTIRVKDPDAVYIKTENLSASNVYNFTKNGNEDGNFNDYHTVFAAVRLTNDGAAAIEEPLIYEAEFGQNVQFVTAVGIPCDWDNGNNGGLPTSITITWDDNSPTTITGADNIRAVASQFCYPGRGFMLLAKDLAEFENYGAGKSIQAVKVELPGLPKDYASAGRVPIQEGASVSNAYSAAWGRVKENVADDATDTNKYRLYEKDAEDTDEIKQWTSVITTVKDSGQIANNDYNSSIANITIDGKSGTTAAGGDMVHVKQTIMPHPYHNGSTRPAETIIVDPVVYILQPEGLTLYTNQAEFTLSTGEDINYKVWEVTGEAKDVPDGWKIYEYTFTDSDGEPIVLGWYDGDWCNGESGIKMNANFTYKIPADATAATYDIHDLIFYKSSLNMPFVRNDIGDPYHLNEGKNIGSVAPSTFTVQPQPQFIITAQMQREGDGDTWYTYDPNNSEATTALLGDDDVVNVKITVTNRTGKEVDGVTVYVPVPKTDSADILGDYFIEDCGFDMVIASLPDLPNGWTAYYGDVTKVITEADNEAGIPSGEFQFTDSGNWSSGSYDNNTNLIRLDLNGTLADGETATLTLKLKPAGDTTQAGETNLFKTWYQFNAAGVVMTDTSKTSIFGAELQNGVVSGVVFADTNRNGVKDANEPGISGVEVSAVDTTGRNYGPETTDESGKYSFTSVPSDAVLTVTVKNPKDPDPNHKGGSYRFSPVGTGTEGVVSNVTAETDNKSASKSGVSLSGGTATINAGLITPYEVSFVVTGGTAVPASVKIYGGQKLSDVLPDGVTATPGEGATFQNAWIKVPGNDGAQSSEVSHENLLNESVSADTTYTAQLETESYTIEARYGNQIYTEKVTHGNKVSENFPTDETVQAAAPEGYEFTGWQLSTGEELLQRETIVGKAVTASATYIAQYAPKSGITVILDPNGGKFGESEETLTLTLTYGDVVATAVGYVEPTRDGHRFLGWAAAADSENVISNLTCPAKDTTYYAVWKENTYTITFQGYEQGSGTKTVQVKAGETIGVENIPEAKKDNATFLGWSDGKNTYSAEELAKVVPKADATYTAQFTDVYTVTFYAGAHGMIDGNPSATRSVASGKTLGDIPTVTGNEGWYFVWWTDASGTKVYTNESLKTQPITSPMYFYAKYGQISGNTNITLKTPVDDNTNSTTLTASLENGTVTSYQWQKFNGTGWEDVTGATGASLFLTGLTMADNNAQYQCVVTSGGNSATIGPVTLSVQKDNQDAPTVSHTDPSTIGGTGSIGVTDPKLTTAMEISTDGTQYKAVTNEQASSGITGIPVGTTYYIRYAETKYLNASDEQIITIDEPNTYTITVAGLEHGSITTDPSGSTTANTEVTLTITPDKDYRLKENSLKVTYQDTGEQTVTVTDNKFTMPAADVIVSAEFEAIQYTITYVLNDGINDADNPTNYTVENAITLSEPTKEGFTFQGWTWDGQDDPQTEVSFEAGSITGNLTFTAHWQANTPTPPTEYTVTVNGSYAVSNGAGSYAVGDEVTIHAGSRENYTFTEWTVTSGDVTLADDSNPTTTFTMPAENVTVTANWRENEPVPAGPVTVTPADIIIYMGGKDGYEGTVNENGEIEASSSLPEPGFVFDLPPELETALDATGEDITDVKFQNEDGTKTWIVQLYQGLDKSATRKLYTIVPTYEDHDPVRVVFTDGDKHIVSDEFTVGLEINKDFGMSLYTGLAGEIKAVYDGKEYPVELGEGILTVLGTTEEVSITTVTETAPTNGQAGAVATAGTTYTINNSEVAVTGGDVSLLFDNIINHTGNDRTSKLEERASEWLAEEGIVPTAQHQFVYELKYLDLVDANNGNAWVTASDDLTIYWPLPAGADADSLKVLHFKDLHRDMDTGEIEDEIADCEVESLTFQIDGNYITFEVGQGGFSPFALVWEEAIPENTFIINATAGSGGSISPSGAVQVTAGGSQMFAITSSSGYHIEDVLVDGTSVGAVSSYTFSNVQGNHTIHAVFDSNGGSVTTPRYIIEAEAGQGGEISPDGRVRVARGSDKTFTITPDKGYRIADVLVDGRSIGVVSRYTFENVRSNHTIKVFFEKYSSVADPDDTGVSEWLDTSDHRDFLHGYTDGTFGPNRNMTRGEVAQMFYNLLLEQDVPQTTAFTDVPADMWCADAVNTLASLGIVEGIGNGLYAPDRAITRAEFTVIAMRFAKLDTSGENIFSDVDTGDWFYEQVVGSIKYGWIQGYADGTFRPDNTITRAEVTTITNRMLGRTADEAFVDRHSDELRQFPDVPESYWAYYNIMEATNAHDFGMENGAEDWTGLN